MSMKKHILKLFAAPAAQAALFSSSRKDTVGGQALIEGVMMRSKERIAWAVRKPDGDAVIESYPFVSITKKSRLWGIPVVRGVINLFESLNWGYKALSRSADIAIEEEEKAAGKDTSAGGKKKKSFMDWVVNALIFIAALAFTFALFKYAPMWTVSLFLNINESPVLFNLIEGIIQIGLFLIYMSLFSLWGDMRRVFEYHGAEHKTIFAYEDGKDLTVDNIDAYGTIHPRCGTSFLILVAICSILISSTIDSLYIQYFGGFINIFHRLAVHIPLIPFIAGLSYEFLKLSDRFQHWPIVGFLIKPGLWLQKITTRKPDAMQIGIAVKALEASL
ncbi:MAG: DUF1385 domain-containing protein [Chitinispirillia bacterium]|nr:DUF1385 domain-containing protein [Chitinispirillia bacterium]MCL2268809.1 DUF1385 domain-containing protein [Chitinispirillia bacterium]